MKIKKCYLIISILSLIIFTLLLIAIVNNRNLAFDTKITDYVYNNIRSNNLTIIMKFITHLGNAGAIFLICILIFLLVKKKIYTYILIINLGCITILNQVIKYMIQRPRPDISQLISENGYSFPSGHSMVCITFYGLIIYYIYKSKINKFLKNIIIIGLLLLILLIGFSRVYLGVHYTSDVLAGYCLGISYLIIFINIINKRKRVYL